MKKIVEWILTAKVLTFPRRYLVRIIARAMSVSRIGALYVLNLQDPETAKAVNLIAHIKRETTMLLSDFCAYQLYTTVKKTRKVKGDIAEVGVYKGGSAKLICEASPHKKIYLFDTFKGLPELSINDKSSHFKKGDYATSFEIVKTYLKKYRNVIFCKGFFPATADFVKKNKFSFVHIDVDLYEATFNCLKFFYPRMNKGGVILGHDYPGAPGVKKAFDDFFRDKPQTIFEIPGTGQCLISK